MYVIVQKLAKCFKKRQPHEETGRKMDPNVVSLQMRKALDSYGKRLFNVSEFLSPQQAKSYFSRHAAKVRQQCDVVSEDIVAADQEANFCSLREAACSNVQFAASY